MNPNTLNAFGDSHLCHPDVRSIRYLSEAVFIAPKDRSALMARLGINNKPTDPLALIPQFGFPRMAAQLSRFTIHPSPEPDHSIEWLLRSEMDLNRYIIAPLDKGRIRWNLRALGITSETLFGSLEALAQKHKAGDSGAGLSFDRAAALRCMKLPIGILDGQTSWPAR